MHLNSGHSLGLQIIESLVKDVIVPLIGNQFIVGVDDGEGIDQSGAQEGVHILRHEFPLSGSVLGPVGEVALHLVCSSYSGVKGTLKVNFSNSLQVK